MRGAKRVLLRAGLWRDHLVRHRFEVCIEGGSNQWGLDYDERGQSFLTHCRSYWGCGAGDVGVLLPRGATMGDGAAHRA
jgi:hypothetical protein